MVWENTDREYPQPGLGEVSLQRTWDNGKPPPNVMGLSTPTPIDWFRDGLPADYVWPPPNGDAPVLIDWREEAGCVAGTPALLTDEGALSVLGAEMPDVRTWQFLLFVWPPAVDDSTGFADLQEANFPGYARIVPTWADPVLTGDAQAATYASTLNWVRNSSSGPEVTIFGWAAVGPGLPSLLRSVQLLPTPITLRLAGDNLTLCPVQLLLGICAGPAPIAFTQVCHVGLGAGLHSAPVGGRRIVGQLGLGISPLSAALIHFAQVGQLGVGAGLHSVPQAGLQQVGQLGVGVGLHSVPHVGFAQVGKVGSGVGLHSVPQVGFHQVGEVGGGVGLEADQAPGFEQEGQLGVGVGGTNPQEGAAPSTPFKFGFDFRGNPISVVDPAYAVCVNGESYPHVYTNANGDSLTAGWVGSATGIDRLYGIDPRLVGLNYMAGPGIYFRVDLPAPGTYSVTLAMGDAIQAASNEWTLLDDTFALESYAVGTLAGDFLDTTATIYDAATWPGSNTPVSLPFATGVLKLSTTTTSDQQVIAHMAVQT